MSGDQGAVPISVILLVALTLTVTGAATTILLVQEPSDQPLAAGFLVQDGERLQLLKTSGEALEAGSTRLYVGTPEGSASIQVGDVPGIGERWTNGQTVCLAGEGPRCLQLEDASEIVNVRVAQEDQALFDRDLEPEVDDIAAGSGPRLSLAGDDGDAGQPDLSLVSLTASSSQPEQGEEVSFGATVANVGDGGTGPSEVRFTVNGTVLDTVALPELGEGESTTVTSSTWTAQGGNNTVSALADPDQVLDGTQRQNNDADSDVAVTAPDPGHAFEDVDNDAVFTPGTDREIPDSDIHDGRYHVANPWSLVIPSSVGPVTADRIDYTAGSVGHIVVDVDLTTTDELVNIQAGSYVQADGVTFTSPDERIRLVSDNDDVYANGSTFDVEDERVLLDAGGDVHATGAELASADERTIVTADGRVNLSQATLEANEKVAITAGDDVDLTDATLAAAEEITIDAVAAADVLATDAAISDEDDVAIVSPEEATITGSPAAGSIAHAGGDGGGGPP